MDSHSNFFIHSLGTNNHINLNFISATTQFSQHHLHRTESASPPMPSILTFAAAVLVNFLELKYQGKNESPFETHPRTMFVAVGSLIAYCIAYDVKSRFDRRVRVKNVCVFGTLMAVFGSVSLAALFSVLLPWFLSPVLFSMSALFSLSRLPSFCKWARDLLCARDFVPTRTARSVSVRNFLEDVRVEEVERRSRLPV